MRQSPARTPRNEHHGSKRPTSLAAALSGAVAAVALASPALAQSTPVGTFTIRVNGGALHSVQSFAQAGASAGTVRFTGSSVDPGGAWEASWDYVADLDPNGNAKLTGSATVKNKGAAASEFEVDFAAPICPFIQSAAKMGGSCSVKIITDANGGAISTVGGKSVFAALADDAAGPKLFHGPFNMGSTGSGTAETANLFGAPFPASAVTAVTSDFGVRHQFKLTDGDAAIITSNLVLGGDPANFVACAEVVAAPPVAAAQAAPPLDPPAAPAPLPAEPVAAPLPVAAGAQPSKQPSQQSGQPAGQMESPKAKPAPVVQPTQPKPGSPTQSTVRLGGTESGKVMLEQGSGKKPAAKKAPPRRPSASAANGNRSSSNNNAKRPPQRRR
jgi:hypothetical protein